MPRAAPVIAMVLPLMLSMWPNFTRVKFWLEVAPDGIRARLAAAGVDWMGESGDGFWRPAVRAQFLTDDGAVLLMHYTGLVEQTSRFAEAAEADEATDWADQYMRLSIRFETGATRYSWLNTSLFVARGRLLGTGHIEYEVFRLT